MVKGLGRFKTYFEPFGGQYILIGGTACDLAMAEVGQSFRATQDLDIVLCAEVLSDAFTAAFWQFIQDGGYRCRERSDGSKEFFRFRNPEVEGFPKEIELFSRRPDGLSIPEGWRMTPIPVAEDISSLSAILLDEDYYGWICQGDKQVDCLHFVGAEYLIPLKIQAWLDLSLRKENGEAIDSRKVKKHSFDVFRLYSILMIEPMASVPNVVKRDVRRFIGEIASVQIDFKNLGIDGLMMQDVLDGLCVVYGV